MSDVNKEVIRAAASTMMQAALNLIHADPHQWSVRPCQTCKAVSAIAFQPFGCVRYLQEFRERQSKAEDRG